MTEGLRVDKGEKLGKSIIFAVDHEHAEKIVKTFKEVYPDKGDDYCQLVDYSVSKVGTIINDFKIPTKEPVIAVSVDMLDTGIDVPEVLNLVFFKRVYSVIKFWQMIGRGTRVCKEFDVFSPSKDFFGKGKEEIINAEFQPYTEKQGFYIFDFCDNFDFFDINPKGKITGGGLNLSQKIFELKLDMVYELQKREHQDNEEHIKFYQKWKNELISLVQNLNKTHVNVRYNLKEVDKYSDSKTWDYVTPLMLVEIRKVITPLIDSVGGESSAKVFDVWMFNIELSHLVGEEDYSKDIFGEDSEFIFTYKYITPPSIFVQEYPISSNGMCLFAASDGNGGYIDLTIKEIDGKEVNIESISITYSYLTNASLTVIADEKVIEGASFKPANSEAYGYTFVVNSSSVRIQNQYNETINHWSVIALYEITINYTIK